jgi:hypothetical protein
LFKKELTMSIKENVKGVRRKLSYIEKSQKLKSEIAKAKEALERAEKSRKTELGNLLFAAGLGEIDDETLTQVIQRVVKELAPNGNASSAYQA